MPGNFEGSEQDVSVKPTIYIAHKSYRKIILIALGGLLAIIFLAAGFNYFYLSNRVVIVINQKQVRLREYKEVSNYLQKILGDSKKSTERANYLFIASQLLEEELLKQGYAFKQADLDGYLSQFKKLPKNNSSGYILDMKVAFLKEKLFQNSVSWYSGFVFMARLTGGEDKTLSDKERATLAEAKIKQIQKEIKTGKSYADLDSEFAQDKGLRKINSGQAYAMTFEKMSPKNPTITSPELLKTIQSLKKDQVSEIFKMSDPKAKTNPIAWAVVKITDLKQGTTGSVEDWLKEAQSKASIKIYGL